VLTGFAAMWVWKVVVHEVANHVRLIRELHARLHESSKVRLQRSHRLRRPGVVLETRSVSCQGVGRAGPS